MGVSIVACQIHLQKVVLLHSCSRPQGFARPKSGRVSGLDVGRRVRSGAVVRAQKEEKEQAEKSQDKLDKVEDKPSEPWSSLQRANAASRIFAATFVWISLFFGISLANNEVGGGRKGRRGPRK